MVGVERMTLDPRFDCELVKQAESGNQVALDIIAGKRVEEEAERILTEVPAVELAIKWQTNVPIYAEVKDDRIAHRTGNVFIEYAKKRFDNQSELVPSGIALTEADVHVLRVGHGNAWIVVPTERLKNLARTAKAEGRVTYGGDDGRFKGALVRLNDIVGSEQ